MKEHDPRTREAHLWAPAETATDGCGISHGALSSSPSSCRGPAARRLRATREKEDAGMTACGEFTRAASQVEMSTTPQFRDDRLLHRQGACQPVWMPANQSARV